MKSKIINYIVKTMNGMAFGLFATLIIGTIIGTIGGYVPEGIIKSVLVNLAQMLKVSMGLGIGIGIAWSLKLDGLKLIAAGVAGQITVYLNVASIPAIGDPLVVYLVVITTIALANLILFRKTPVDIIIIPLVFALLSGFISKLIYSPVAQVTTLIGKYIETATIYQPFIMGIVISVIMGMALTAPISSAAIAVAIHLDGLAAGAAVIGCCVQMVGFAVMSRKDNNIGTVISVGIGTSMLQFKNIVKKPLIWLPTIIVSAILGPLGTVVFKTRCNEIGAGMGTSGLVGPINTFSVMERDGILSVALLMVVLPIILVWIIDVIFRKYQLIKPGDLKI